MTFKTSNDQDDIEKITGVVVAINRKKDSDLVPLLISVPSGIAEVVESDDLMIEDGTEYFYVANNKRGQELMDFVDRMVEVTGVVVKNSEGRKTIFVDHCDVVE